MIVINVRRFCKLFTTHGASIILTHHFLIEPLLCYTVAAITNSTIHFLFVRFKICSIFR